MRKYASYVTKIIRGRVSGKNIPLLVTICLTNRCNLRCRYCYGEYYQRRHREFTTEELLDLIDELTRLGTKYISLNGGEPLLRDDIGIIVDKINKKNILCHLSTNGLLAKENIPSLKKVDSLAISIDGDREGNDLNRGRGTYDKIIEAMECLNNNNIKFHTHTVLTKNNKSGLKELMPLALKFGFKAQFSTLRVEDSLDKTIGLDDGELKEAVRDILNYKRRGFPIFFSYESYKNVLAWPFSYSKQALFDEVAEGYKPMECFMKRFSCHIEANGLVYPCIVLVNKFRALNFLKFGFKKAWENLADNGCRACYNVCCNNLNLIFALRPSSIWNAFKIVMGRI